MKKILKLLIFSGVIISMAFSCKKEEVLSPHQAKGKVLAKFAMCYGAWVMIDVENPKGIGKAGEFIYNGDQKLIYKNAIGVPYFDRMPWLDTNAPDSFGTWLYFEYRELTQEECCNEDLFRDTSFTVICPANIVPPSVPRYMITKIIDYH
jgi:hypothetical protein